MKNFWENSPEWRRMQQAEAAWEAARQVEDKAVRIVLACVRNKAVAPLGEYWRECCTAYRDASEAREAAYDAWKAADRAFEASAVGQARARYYKDPLAFREVAVSGVSTDGTKSA